MVEGGCRSPKRQIILAQTSSGLTQTGRPWRAGDGAQRSMTSHNLAGAAACARVPRRSTAALRLGQRVCLDDPPILGDYASCKLTSPPRIPASPSPIAARQLDRTSSSVGCGGPGAAAVPVDAALAGNVAPALLLALPSMEDHKYRCREGLGTADAPRPRM